MKKNVGAQSVQGLALKYGAILGVILSASLIFALRYKPAFQIPNFYAEDGRVFVNTIFEQGYIEASITSFNGYLVAGQYLLADVAVGIHTILGLPLYDLPFILAIVSCLFLGLTVSLPYILFRKELGTKLSLLAVLLGALVPLPAFDYAVIGTLGNLKFAFLYWAVLLILYRHLHRDSIKKVLLTDGLLLLCILTNASLVLLIPFLVISHRKELMGVFRFKSLKPMLSIQFISMLLLGAISLLYICLIYVKGIPELPGYLDSPYEPQATLKILYRVTLYAWLFPASDTLRGSLILILLTGFIWLMFRKAANRYVLSLGLWAILTSTLSFVANRPGISSFYKEFSVGTTDQFFYPQSLVFIFMTIWGVAVFTKRFQHHRTPLVAASIVYLLWSVPLGSSYGDHAAAYRNLGTAEQNIPIACNASSSDLITIQTYPDGNWLWTLPRTKAC